MIDKWDRVNVTGFRMSRKSNDRKVTYEFLDDNYLSWRAKGLLAYLITFSNNSLIPRSLLVDKGIDGKNTLKTCVAELIYEGYMKRETLLNKWKKVIKSVYLFSDKRDFLGESKDKEKEIEQD